MKKKYKIIGLIPSRLRSRRLPFKALLPINNIPLIIHTYKRAKMSKLIDDVIICCDDKKILKVAKKYKANAILTSTHHSNGTERIFEAYLKIKKKYDFIINIYGDEPLISPIHIDKVIDFHIKNDDADIILPYFKIKNVNNTNIVKLVINNKKELMYLSRANVPFEFRSKSKYLKKHLSILSLNISMKKFIVKSFSQLFGSRFCKFISFFIVLMIIIAKLNSFRMQMHENIVLDRQFFDGW